MSTVHCTSYSTISLLVSDILKSDQSNSFAVGAIVIRNRLREIYFTNNVFPEWFNVPFQHKYGYIRDKRSGVESYPYPVKKGQRYINLNAGRLFVQQPPQRERDQEAHLNYYARAYNRGRQLSHRKTKLNQIQQNTRINLN